MVVTLIFLYTQNTNDISITLSNNPSISSLTVSGQVTAGTLSDGAGTTITSGTVNTTALIATTTVTASIFNFNGSPLTGFSTPSANTLNISTAGTNRLQINAAGTINIPAFTPAGVVHNDASGNLFSSGLITSDFSNSNVVPNSALQQLTASNLVANSATTATSSDVANTIVSRDGTGSFAAHNITADSNFLAANGTAAAPSISFTNALGAGLSASSTGTLSISSGSSGAGVAQIVLNAAGNQIQFPLLGAGIIHASSTGFLSSSPVSLTTDVSGILPIANGGTGFSNSTSNAVLLANASAVTLSNGQLLIGSTGVAPVAAQIQSTANQTTVTNGAGSITIGTVQNIGVTSSPTFASETLANTSNQLTLGTTNQTIINATAPAATRTYTIPDTGANSSFVMTDGNQTINGNKTFSGTTSLSSLTPSLPLQLNASNQIISAPLTPASFSGILTVTQGGTGAASIGMNAILASNSTGTAIIPLSNLTNGQIFIGSTGVAPVAAQIQSTANQTTVTNGAGSITIGTVQNIGVTSSPTFASETLANTSNQLTLGTTNQTIINATAPAATRTYTIPDTGANSSFVMTDGNQIINGNKTFSGTTSLSSLTPSLPLQLNASNQIISAPLTPASFSGILTVTQGGTGAASIGMNAILASNPTGTAIIPLANLTNGQIFIGSTGAAPVAATIAGTTNEINVATGAGSITLSTPRPIATTSSPTFASETLTNTLNQLTLGTTNQTIINATAPAATRTYTIPDTETNSSFIMNSGVAQIISSTLTLSNTVNLSSLAASLPLQFNASNNIISQAIALNSGSVSGILPIANGGTNSGTALINNRIMVSSGGSIVESAALTNGQLLIGSTGAAPVANSIAGTPNQVIVTNGAGTIGLSLPQNIATTSSPTFASEALANTSNQLTLGTGNTIMLSAPTPAASRIYYIPDVLTTSTFVMVDGAQYIGGAKTFGALTTFNNTVNLSNLTPSLPLQLNASNNIITQSISLTSGVSGILPIANGGTNSGTALTNNKVMVSSGGQIVESTVSTGQLALLSTATSSDVINTLILRDGTGSFTATNITTTGILTVAAGSAASPSIQFSGSTNTGISSINTNTLVFSTDGISRLSIGSDGETTIAAPSAGTALTVNGLPSSATALAVTGTGMFTTGLEFGTNPNNLGGNFLNAVGATRR